MGSNTEVCENRATGPRCDQVGWIGAEFTMSVVDPLIDPNAAVMSVEPTLTPKATPCDPTALLIVATVVVDEVQVTEVVRFLVLPSL